MTSDLLTAVRWYDSQSIVFIFVIWMALQFAVDGVAVDGGWRKLARAAGFAVAIGYLCYRHTLGDFEFPATTLGAVLRALWGGGIVRTVLVLVAVAWDFVFGGVFGRARTGTRSVGRGFGKLWKWL